MCKCTFWSREKGKGTCLIVPQLGHHVPYRVWDQISNTAKPKGGCFGCFCTDNMKMCKKKNLQGKLPKVWLLGKAFVAGTDKTPSLHNTAETIHEYKLKIQMVKKLQRIQNQLPLKEQIWPKELMNNFSGTRAVLSIKYSLWRKTSQFGPSKFRKNPIFECQKKSSTIYKVLRKCSLLSAADTISRNFLPLSFLLQLCAHELCVLAKFVHGQDKNWAVWRAVNQDKPPLWPQFSIEGCVCFEF